TYFKKVRFIGLQLAILLQKGDMQARMIFWERPVNEAKLKADFNYELKSDTTGFVRKGWVLGYQVNNKNFVVSSVCNVTTLRFQSASTPTDFDLEEWYIHKNAGSDTVVGCIEGTSNYTISAQKVRTDFLLEAGSLATAPKSIFDSKKCPTVDKINQQQA